MRPCRRFLRSPLKLLASLCLALVPAITSPVRAAEGPIIAVAASLRPAVEEIARSFAADAGLSVRLTFGASGTFVRQIESGAPFEALLAADTESIDRLAAAGRTKDAGFVLARGRLAIVTRKGSGLAVDSELKGLAVALAAGRIERFAIANPELAPYGRAAREVLGRAGLLAGLDGRIVLAENIGQAAQFVASGAAQAGLVAYSLTVSEPLSSRLDASVIPQGWHVTIDQKAALLQGAGATADGFVAYARGPKGRAVLERHGFTVPDGQ